MKALVGSTNKIKITGAKKALEKYYSNKESLELFNKYRNTIKGSEYRN